jgi:hypothetical protein
MHYVTRYRGWNIYATISLKYKYSCQRDKMQIIIGFAFVKRRSFWQKILQSIDCQQALFTGMTLFSMKQEISL